MGPALITIRPFRAADVGAAAAMEAACRPQPWTEETIESELSTEGRVYLVADNDELVGFAGAAIAGEEAHVTNLLVDPAMRRNGVGRRLMIALIKAAVAEGANVLTLEVATSDAATRSLYTSLGFVPAGARRGYYGDDDALVMRACDVDSEEYAERLR